MRLRTASAGLLAAGLVTVTGCGGETAPTASPTPVPSATPTQTDDPGCDAAEAAMAFDLDIRLRQLLFAGIFTGEPDPLASANFAASAGVGGMNFLGNDPEVYADGELAEVTAAGGEFPPFLAVDQEGGRVQRLSSLIGSQPSAREMGATLSVDEVEELAAQTGDAMAGLGLNMDLAPVADVSDQADDTVIGDRAFSDDPDVVADYAGAYADGLRSAGIIPVLKHFPGIGSASGNTDFEPATSPPLSELQQRDLLPYDTLLEDEPVAVMMGTAVVPDLTDGEPAALSPPAVDLLRSQFGFDGVVMTDSLSGTAVESLYSLPEAAELALVAGVDMVLWDSAGEIQQIVDRLTQAVDEGRLTEQRVNESFARVLALKQLDICALAESRD